MSKTLRIAFVFLLLVLLVTIRAVEEIWFYDSFMHFFHGYKAEEYLSWSLHMRIVLRFLLNTFISLAILYLVFRSGSVVKFSAYLYMILLVVLFPLYMFLMQQVESGDFLAAFYVRKFLVHPIMILLLLPAFYYHRLKGKSV